MSRLLGRRSRDGLRPAIVLGVGDGTGLTVVRDLGRLGVPVLAVDCQARALGLASRYARALRCTDPHYDEDGFIDGMLVLAARLGDGTVVLPTQDDFVASVSRHAGRLEGSFALPVCRRDTMERLNDKESQVRAAWEAAVPTPATSFIHAAGDLERAATTIRFPAVLKATAPLAFSRRLGVKVLAVDTPDDLPAAYARVADCGPLMLQEVIPGDDDALLIAATYHDAQSRPLAVFTGRKLRQHPRGFGNTRVAESRWSDEVADMTLRLLALLGYRGVSDVEFKRDPRDGRLKFMEINARHGLWAGLATAAGVNLSEVAYRDAIGDPFTAPRQADGVVWTHLLHDTKDSLGEWRSGQLTLRDWVRPLTRMRADAVIALDDPMPAVCVVSGAVRRRVSEFGRSVPR